MTRWKVSIKTSQGSKLMGTVTTQNDAEDEAYSKAVGERLVSPMTGKDYVKLEKIASPAANQ